MKKNLFPILVIFLFLLTSKGVSNTFLSKEESPIKYPANTLHTDSLFPYILDDYIDVFASYYYPDFEGNGKGFSEFSEKNHIIRVFKDSTNVELINIMILRFYFFSEIPFADYNVLFYKGNYFYYNKEELSDIKIPVRLIVPDSLKAMVVDSNFKDDYYKNISIMITHIPIVFSL